MQKDILIESSTVSAPKKATVLVLVNDKRKTTFEVEKMIGKALIERIVAVRGFKGEKLEVVDEVCDGKKGFDRLVLLGVGNTENLSGDDWVKIGGAAFASLKDTDGADIYLTVAGEKLKDENILDFVLGLRLRNYTFDEYKTASTLKETKSKPVKLMIQLEDAKAGKVLFERANSLANSVLLARDLVNQPANILGTKDFVKEVEKLEKIGVKVEILDEKDMKKLGMLAFELVIISTPESEFFVFKM